jgi:threonine/homoserine/homoserine lactone efflux protein
MLLALVVGIALGFVGSIPVAGPISLLVFAQGVARRYQNALAIAAGGAAAEGLYACFAFWGYGQLLAKYPFIRPISQALGALLLIGIGVAFAWRREPPASEPATPADRKRRGVLLGFTLTALNPTLLVTWTAASSTLLSSGVLITEPKRALLFALGVVVGIVAWFGVLLALLHHFRDRFRKQTLHGVVRVIGVIVACVGMVMAWECWQTLG